MHHLVRTLGVPWLALLGACAHHNQLPSSTATLHGDTNVTLLRPSEGGVRIYVQAKLPDGELGLFLVDTGADISVLSEDTATRLGLTVEDSGRSLAGLGGSVPMRSSTLSTLGLGDAVVRDVEVAVGVPGVAEYAGWMPQDGIIGNNVWSQFLVEVDYPADLLVLHEPGTARAPRKAAPMYFNGFINTPVSVTTSADPPHTADMVIQVDTGASALLISGNNGQSLFQRDYTEGIEPILGIGGSDLLPASQYLRTTRRIGVQNVHLGGIDLPQAELEARWINYADQGVGPVGMQGLAGHELLDGHVAWFDYEHGAFALTESKRTPRQVNGHQVLMDQELAAHPGSPPDRRLYRARLLIGLDREDEAIELLAEQAAEEPTDHEARILLARMYRSKGRLAEATAALEGIDPGTLVDEKQLIATVNALLLEQNDSAALALAEAALTARPKDPAPYVARADAHLAAGRFSLAEADLLAGAKVNGDPDAFLDRRARVALAQGDRYGAMSHLRNMLQIYPFNGPFMWFYSQLAEPDDRPTVEADIRNAMARLHPFQRPVDFQVGASHQLGDQARADELMQGGVDRDCDALGDDAQTDNCVAWYHALASRDLDDALVRVDRALEVKGPRSDFLDTKALVELRLGNTSNAADAALQAARMAPDDVYMLWQAERLASLATQP